MSHSAHSLSLYISEHNGLVPKTEELSPANENGASKTLILRQPIKIEHLKTFQLRQPIKIEYYVTRVFSHSESSIASRDSSPIPDLNTLTRTIPCLNTLPIYTIS